jgi:hypothetical protein
MKDINLQCSQCMHFAYDRSPHGFGLTGVRHPGNRSSHLPLIIFRARCLGHHCREAFRGAFCGCVCRAEVQKGVKLDGIDSTPVGTTLE